MLARRAASALATATIARPAAACLAVLERCVEAGSAPISLAADPSRGQALAPPRLPPAGPGSSGGLFCGPGSSLQPSAAQQLKLLRCFNSSSSSSSLEERQRSKGSSSKGSSSSEDRSGLSEAQLQAAAERLLCHSRSQLKTKAHSTDESMQQRMALLLRLGFSQAAIEKAIQRQGGGPYIAEQQVSEAVAVLRRWSFSQQHLDNLLAGGRSFSRAAADIEAVLVWLHREFRLQRTEVAKACGRSPTLLNRKQASLAASWQALVQEFQPTEDAVRQLAAVLRKGDAHFLLLTPDTLRHKVAQLQALFGLDSSDVPRKIGHLAAFFCLDIKQTAKPRFQLLQQLTGQPAARLAGVVMQHPRLLYVPEAMLQRKFDAVLAAMGPADGTPLVQRRPDILKATEGRVAANLLSLQQLGTTAVGARQVLTADPRLATIDMQSEATAARLRARVAFWQQAYGLMSTGDAIMKCASMLSYNLRTVAPRVAFYQAQRSGQALPGFSLFARSDAAFCKLVGADPAELAMFKAQWLASEEGRVVCAHEAAQ